MRVLEKTLISIHLPLQHQLLKIVKHKIYILDDHPIVIEGLRKIIDAQEEYRSGVLALPGLAPALAEIARR